MEKDDKTKRSLLNKLGLATIGVIGILAIAPKQNQTNEITSIYQGYTSSDGYTYLVFDNKPRQEREGLPELVIKGNPDTLEIGKEYTIKYSSKVKKEYIPKKIKEIKYSQ